jgi:hypothetical protein
LEHPKGPELTNGPFLRHKRTEWEHVGPTVEEIRQKLPGRIEWAAVGKQVFPGTPAINPQIAMKPATLWFVFDPGFVRSAYVRLCVDF